MKDIEGIKMSTRSDMCESILGIYPIISDIDERKLSFFGKLCNLDTDSLTKHIFLSRLYDFINNDEIPFSGFLKDLDEILNKYNLLQHLRTFTEKCQFPGRNKWK